MELERIKLAHGSGGKQTNSLIKELILKYIGNPILNNLDDGAILEDLKGEIVFTTDSYVVSPIFFNGGDIGKLAITGTVNDIAVSGGIAKYISLSFIIEEGFLIEDFKKILNSIKKSAEEVGVLVVTGDTKVVEKGKGDKIFINTSGIGVLHKKFDKKNKPQPGDVILINGPVGDHGAVVMAKRSGIELETELKSDCAPVSFITTALLDNGINVKFMRDPTRGGVAAVLNEIAQSFGVGIELNEENIQIRPEVEGVSEILGIEPLYFANEGKVIVVVDKNHAQKALEIMKNHKYGERSSIIGEVVDEHKGYVVLNTLYGGKRIVDMPIGEQLPRIC